MKHEHKHSLAYIDGMLNNPLQSIETTLADIKKGGEQGDRNASYQLGYCMGALLIVQADIETIKDYINEQLE